MGLFIFKKALIFIFSNQDSTRFRKNEIDRLLAQNISSTSKLIIRIRITDSQACLFNLKPK